MSQDNKPSTGSKRGAKPLAKDRKRSSGNEREGTEGNNAIQHEPDDSKQVSMLDSGKHSEKSPYTAGSQ
ncbi:hypothetical protein BH11PSE7_BH11PSE7_31550 [soil metagenome]